jgi:hypothetical protein
MEDGISGRLDEESKAAAWLFRETKSLPGATVSRKAREVGSIKRAFKVTSHTLVGFVAASVISARGGGEIFWAAEVWAGVSMLRCVVELDVRYRRK